MSTAPNTETYSQQGQLTDANPDGTILGQSTSDKIGFYGRIPYPQRVVGYVSLLTTTTATSSGSIWGAYSTTASGTASTWSASSISISAYATATMGSVLSEVVNTLIGLGIWKAASV